MNTARKPAVRGATVRKVRHSEKRGAWFRHHRTVALGSLFQLIRKPISSFLTWMVIAIALSLPALFYMAMANVSQVTQGLHKTQQISLYLNEWVSSSRGQELATELNQRTEISSTRYISAAVGLQEFSQYSGLSTLFEDLSVNPLPNTIVLIPNTDDPAMVEGLTLILSGLPEVDDIQLDMQWVHRLNQIGLILTRVIWLLSGVFALAVVLVVGNTIRLSIESRREEILVIKLLGATNAYVRRPFLYMGFWYGLLGGLAATALVNYCYYLLQAPVTALASSFESSTQLAGLGVEGTFLLLVGSIVVSLFGSMVAVGRHIRQIEPK